MSKYIYFVRHGECEANVKGVIAGGTNDSPLTDLGRQQASDTAKKLQDIKFDLIITSPMGRTVDTANIIADKLGFSRDRIRKVPEFTEKDVGEFAGKSKEEYFAFEKSGGEAGETSAAMQDRVRKGLKWLKIQTFTNVLVVSHNGTIRMVRTVLEGLPAKEFVNLPYPENGEYYKFDLEQYDL